MHLLLNVPKDFREGHWSRLSQWDLAQNATIVSVTDDRFSEARNLISPHEPVWDPQAFGYIGKVMDSWESQRHNPLEADVLELKLASPSSTKESPM